MSFRAILVLILAVTCGVATVIGVRSLQKSLQGQAGTTDTPAVPTTPVLVYAPDVQRGQTLTAENVTVQKWPEGSRISTTEASLIYTVQNLSSIR